MSHRLRQAVQRPDFTTNLLQIAKGVTASTAAWALSVYLLDSDLPFLAPWTALLTVHATVYRSLSRGVQTTIASAIGVALSFLIGAYLGVSVWTFALAILVGLVVSRLSWIRDEGVAIATTAIFVLGSGFPDEQTILVDRIIEVGVGVAVGIAVNLLLIPPLRDRQASRYVDNLNRRMGDVLINMSDEFSTSWDTDQADAWFDETESMTRELDSAWQSVRFARESRLANPRRRLPTPRRPRTRWQRSFAPKQEVGYEDILARVDEGISHLRHLARTLREASYSEGAWNTRFRENWVAIVRDCGHAIADPEAEVEPIYDRLTALAANLSDDRDLPPTTWPIYGSLIESMRHIVVIVDDVASAREARESTADNPVA